MLVVIVQLLLYSQLLHYIRMTLSEPTLRYVETIPDIAKRLNRRSLVDYVYGKYVCVFYHPAEYCKTDVREI